MLKKMKMLRGYKLANNLSSFSNRSHYQSKQGVCCLNSRVVSGRGRTAVLATEARRKHVRVRHVGMSSSRMSTMLSRPAVASDFSLVLPRYLRI